jgi:hypothetical protein
MAFLSNFWNGLAPALKFVVVLVGITVVFFPIFLWFIDTLSVIAMALLFTSIGIGGWVMFDHFVLKEIDTVEMAKNNPVVYAAILIAAALIFSASIMAGSGSITINPNPVQSVIELPADAAR